MRHITLNPLRISSETPHGTGSPHQTHVMREGEGRAIVSDVHGIGNSVTDALTRHDHATGSYAAGKSCAPAVMGRFLDDLAHHTAELSELTFELRGAECALAKATLNPHALCDDDGWKYMPSLGDVFEHIHDICGHAVAVVRLQGPMDTELPAGWRGHRLWQQAVQSMVDAVAHAQLSAGYMGFPNIITGHPIGCDWGFDFVPSETERDRWVQQRVIEWWDDRNNRAKHLVSELAKPVPSEAELAAKARNMLVASLARRIVIIGRNASSHDEAENAVSDLLVGVFT